MPTNIRGAFSCFLSRLQSKVKIGNTFSENWLTATCGTPQGNAKSIIWANLASVVLAQTLSCAKPVIGSKTYVDDRYLWIRNISQLKKARVRVKEFEDLACNRLNPGKTKVMSTSRHLRMRAKEVMFDGHTLVQ